MSHLGQNGGFDLVAPVEWATHGARVEPMEPAAPVAYEDLDYGCARVLVARAGAIRFERSARAASRLPRRIMLLHVFAGVLHSRIQGRRFTIRATDTVLYDIAEPASFECADGVVLIGLAVDAELVTSTRPGDFAPATLARTTLVESTLAFVSALVCDRAAARAESEAKRLGAALAALQCRVVSEAKSTEVDAACMTARGGLRPPAESAVG